MKEILWNWAIEQARKAVQALWWAIQKVGELLIVLINKIGDWLETIFH